MIYTVTFNPAIDYVMHMKCIRSGEVNRSDSEEIFFGGKGINVSVVLNELGISSVATGFTAGFTGEALEKGISAAGIKTDFVQLKSGTTRINVKLKADTETDINGQGPDIGEDDIDGLFRILDKLKDGDILILAGSIPDSLPQNMYERILERLSGKGIGFVADATKDLLLNVLRFKPFLIKPNNHELGEMFGVEIKDKNDVVTYARRLKDMGAENVLVSMAGNGSVLLDEYGRVHAMGVPKGRVLNSVGAGDSMVAGFMAGYLKTKDYEYALRLGTASGSATAFSPGLARRGTIEELLKTI